MQCDDDEGVLKVCLLEQYKLYVETVDKIADRRAQTNRFYISILSGLLVLLSIISSINIFTNFQTTPFITVAILGLILCVLWNENIKSYQKVNSGKFKIIDEMEQHLPFPCFSKEWDILSEGKEYLPVATIEQYITFLLAVPFLLLLIYSLLIL